MACAYTMQSLKLWRTGKGSSSPFRPQVVLLRLCRGWNLTHEGREWRGQLRRKKIMKLITAQEIQNMNENDLTSFFNNLSREQARRETEDAHLSRSVGNVSLKLDLYSEYAFD
jgi:hypothetical protein